jgi:hypothetical protein
VDQNPTISMGDPATEPVVPSYIPPLNQIDLYTPVVLYEEVGESVVNQIETQVTMTVDMNRVLTENQVTPFGS